jgi:hypothetical protein
MRKYPEAVRGTTPLVTNIGTCFGGWSIFVTAAVWKISLLGIAHAHLIAEQLFRDRYAGAIMEYNLHALMSFGPIKCSAIARQKRTM